MRIRGMAALHDGLEAAWSVGDVGRLLLIGAYVLDFLSMHPYSRFCWAGPGADGGCGAMARHACCGRWLHYGDRLVGAQCSGNSVDRSDRSRLYTGSPVVGRLGELGL